MIQQDTSVAQVRICSDDGACCHTEIDAGDQTCYLTQSNSTDTGPTSPFADPISPSAWQGGQWSVPVLSRLVWTRSEIVKRHKLKWYGHVTKSSGLTTTILQGTVHGGRRRDRQRKRWEDNIREWTGLEWNILLRKAENRDEWRRAGCKTYSGASTVSQTTGWMR